MLACSRQLQGIFGLLKPLLHVQIWTQSLAFYLVHGKDYRVLSLEFLGQFLRSSDCTFPRVPRKKVHGVYR